MGSCIGIMKHLFHLYMIGSLYQLVCSERNMVLWSVTTYLSWVYGTSHPRKWLDTITQYHPRSRRVCRGIHHLTLWMSYAWLMISHQTIVSQGLMGVMMLILPNVIALVYCVRGSRGLMGLRGLGEVGAIVIHEAIWNNLVNRDS